jgi:glutathione S-transferase
VTETLFHLAEADQWALAQESGAYRRSTLGLSLEDVGFIHLSTDEQWPGVLGRYYTGHTGDLVLLSIDPDLLDAELRWEAPHPGASELFPHLFGPLPVAAVTSTRVLEPPFGR